MTHTFEVEQWAFCGGEIREVDIPLAIIPDDTEDILETVYKYGQNEIQAKDCPSVSMGDIILLEGKKFLVRITGFQSLTDETYNGHVNNINRLRACF